MAQKKNHEVDSWLARPDPAVRIVLVYGPDRGLVSERAARFAAKTGIPLDDPFANVRLDAGEIESDPGRLFDEARTVSMFSAARLLWIRGGGGQKGLAEAVRELAKSPPADAILLIEAGDLKKSAPLRTVVEQASAAMALPCYSDDDRALDGLMLEIMQANDLTMGSAARSALRQQIGGDRLATRGEIEKLALYGLGRGEITEADISALIGDVSATSADDALNAALTADLKAFEAALSRFVQGGGNHTTLLIAAIRQIQTIEVLKADMERSGRNAGAVVASARPPIYFERKVAVERALSRLSNNRISSILQRLQTVMLESRKTPDLADTLIERALLAIAAT